MELILWRHAEAEMGEPDEGRKLTPKGQKQAVRMGDWLDRHLPSSCRVLVSPAARTLETAEALGRKFKVIEELAPDSTAERVIAATNWPDSREPVLVVGHQPLLGQVAAILLGGSAQDWSIRKGNIWWIVRRERDGVVDHYLRTVLSPELVGK